MLRPSGGFLERIFGPGGAKKKSPIPQGGGITGGIFGRMRAKMKGGNPPPPKAMPRQPMANKGMMRSRMQNRMKEREV